MKSIRKIIWLTVSIILLISSLTLVGCSSKSENTSSSKENVTLNILQSKVEIAKKLEEAAKIYSEGHPNIKINIQTVDDEGDYREVLKAKLQSAEELSIFNICGPQDVKDLQWTLIDLTREPWVKQAIEGTLEGVTVDKKVYGLPFAIEGYGFIYNKGIFEAANIDSEIIKDYATLETAVKSLDAKIKSGALKSKYPKLEAVFEMPAKENLITGLYTSNVALAQEFKSSVDAFEAKKVQFKYSNGLKALYDIQADYSSNVNSKGSLNAVDYNVQVDKGIAIERVAIVQQGNWIFNDVSKINPNVAKNLDILPMPVKGAKENTISVGVPMYWAVSNKGSKAQQDAAKNFLNWLYTSDKGKDFIVNKFLCIPALKGYEKVQPKDCLSIAINKYVESGKTSPWVFMGYPTGWGEKIFGKEIGKYLAGEEKWEDVIKNSQKKWIEVRKNEQT